jgi:hypothetical protein
MIKVGDRVICKPGFNREENSGGSGYKENRIFTVVKIDEDENDRNSILWAWDYHQDLPDHDYRDHYLYCGVYSRVVRKLDPLKPIRQLKKHTIGNMGRENELVTT